MTRSADTQDWLKRLALSLLIAGLVGALGYLVARAISTAYLFYQQQQFFQETASLLQGGGVPALADSNLRELRFLAEALNAQYHRLSIQLGFAAAAIGGIGCFVWLERRAAREETDDLWEDDARNQHLSRLPKERQT
ncbi:MAG: hypothetical protein MI924_01620 [Chloroflexales bacterium]|nr:hypothetical protein [Chloroflexales bacterium]